MIMKTLKFFVGVNAGYVGNQVEIKSAATAAEIISGIIPASASVKQAVTVYHTEWGCPDGGEPCGAVCWDGASEIQILALAKFLKVALCQSTVSVPLSGTPTIGFQAVCCGELTEVGSKWQEVAAEVMKTTGTYVSCGIYENGGELIIQAEANPAFVKDVEAWKSIVAQLCEKVEATDLEFSEVGFTYFNE